MAIRIRMDIPPILVMPIPQVRKNLIIVNAASQKRRLIRIARLTPPHGSLHCRASLVVSCYSTSMPRHGCSGTTFSHLLSGAGSRAPHRLFLTAIGFINLDCDADDDQSDGNTDPSPNQNLLPRRHLVFFPTLRVRRCVPRMSVGRRKRRRMVQP